VATCIHYEEAGSGFPLLLIPGGGLNSAISWWSTGAAFNAMEEFKDDFRCISMDLRNANTGQSTGPLQIEKPWDAYAERIVNISPLRRRSPSGWPPACDVICHS
jgi:pimeloyl-ACP methyl ester carboxylesterase